MGVNLGSTILFVVCVGFARQLGNGFSVLQGTAQHYRQENAIHSRRAVTKPGRHTKAFKNLPRFGESRFSAVRYGFPDGAGIEEYNQVNLTVTEIPDIPHGSKKGRGILDGVTPTHFSPSSQSEILADSDGNRLKGSADLSAGLYTSTTGIKRHGPLPSTSDRRRVKTTKEPRQNRKRKLDIRLRYFFPKSLKDINSTMLFQGSKYAIPEYNTNNNDDSRLYVFRTSTPADVPLDQETEKESQNKVTLREGITKTIILPRKVDNDESHQMNTPQHMKKSIDIHQALISNFSPDQNQKPKRVMMSVLERKQRQEDLAGIVDNSNDVTKSADFFLLGKTKKQPLTKKSAASRHSKLKTAPSLKPHLTNAWDETADENLLDSVEKQTGVPGTRKSWPAGTIRNKIPSNIERDDADMYLSGLEKEYALMKHEANQAGELEKRPRGVRSKIGAQQTRASGRDRASYFIEDVQVYDDEIGENDAEDKMLDFIIDSNKVQPAIFDIHSSSNKVQPAIFDIHSSFADSTMPERHRRTTKNERLPVRPVGFAETRDREIVIPWVRPTADVAPVANPYRLIPGFIADNYERTVSHGTKNTEQEHINERIAEDLFQSHLDDAVDKLDYP